MDQREQWTSKIGFILAAAGSAIGLGAIWKFPYVAGNSGGGAFFLIFILFTLLVGLPLLLAEFIIGRSTQKEAISAYKAIAPGTSWHLIGRLGVVTCFILLSFYSVVGGWILLYIGYGITGNLTGQDYEALFGMLISHPVYAVIGQFSFMIIVMVVVAKGIQRGIETASRYMMPALFIAFIILIVRSLTLEDALAGVSFFLKPDFSVLSSESILFAMGQSFFALSVGVSVMVTYSSYLSKTEDLTRSAFSIVVMNVFISLLAGLAIFPAVFSFGFEPAGGPGLLFIVLPAVFQQMPFGFIFLMIFLGLFLFATLTSAFSMLEIIVSSLARGNNEKRVKVTWVSGFIIFLVGIPAALSFGILGEITLFEKTIFDLADYLVSNILMPIGALLIAIFVPRRISKKTLLQEITKGASNRLRLFSLWFLLIRYVIPVIIVIVFLDVIGIL
ncbi:sodium-dependent transporter [Bacillus taeanensis]|uniref:Transporter n=1 Tax=Bacillus taeanensis TaxID=273032 RepID=A0A366Y1S4_9BACI|nr:sodium-dependent transporter [Bacillus taeanensis]RBW71335.1 hypothetical protein DS031_00870 [Bacillus taeanensis]